MVYKSAVIITGPTTTGKTELAFELVRRAGGGEIICADKLMLFKGFPVSTGLSDTLKNPEIPIYLYQTLNPEEGIPEISDYVSKVNLEVDYILKNNGLPVIEGCSFSYFNNLYYGNNNENSKYFPLIGLKWSNGLDLEKRVEKRIEVAFQEGILDEIKEGLKKGYRNTYIMSNAIGIVPIVEYLDGKISLEDAKKRIFKGVLNIFNDQLEEFLEVPDIKWIENDAFDLSQKAEKILRMLPD
ncbi:hypothetical protein HQ529_05325 [Candidatus Woesearchaeota archaeon]|nr:hypothetical protein [Candidatus Woesearchaeota archaeon]